MDVLEDVPARRSNVDECLGRRDATLGDCDNTEATKQRRISRESRRAAGTAGADFVTIRQWFCADGVCPPVIGSVVPMRDRQHVTTDYAATLTEPLLRKLGLTGRR